MESATSVEGTKADNVRVAMAEPSKLVQDSPLSSDVDTQQSTIGQFLLADELIVWILFSVHLLHAHGAYFSLVEEYTNVEKLLAFQMNHTLFF